MKRYAKLYCNDIEVKIKNLTIIKLKFSAQDGYTTNTSGLNGKTA